MNAVGRMDLGFQGHIEGGSRSGKFDQYAVYIHEIFRGWIKYYLEHQNT